MEIIANVNVVTVGSNGKKLNLKAGKSGDVRDDLAEELVAEGFADAADKPKARKKTRGPSQTTKNADGEEEDEGKTKRRRSRQELLGTSAKTVID